MFDLLFFCLVKILERGGGVDFFSWGGLGGVSFPKLIFTVFLFEGFPSSFYSCKSILFPPSSYPFYIKVSENMQF